MEAKNKFNLELLVFIGISSITLLTGSYLGSLDVINRISALSEHVSYQTYKENTKNRMIDDFFKKYDLNKDNIIDKDEYVRFVKDYLRMWNGEPNYF